jgi:hypothetical protein
VLLRSSVGACVTHTGSVLSKPAQLARTGLHTSPKEVQTHPSRRRSLPVRRGGVGRHACLRCPPRSSICKRKLNVSSIPLLVLRETGMVDKYLMAAFMKLTRPSSTSGP